MTSHELEQALEHGRSEAMGFQASVWYCPYTILTILDCVVPVQVMQGDGILWEGDLPSSLRLMTMNELEQALRDRHLSEAASSTENGKQSSHTIYVPLPVQLLFNTMHSLPA